MKNKKIEDGNFLEKKNQFCIGLLSLLSSEAS